MTNFSIEGGESPHAQADPFPELTLDGQRSSDDEFIEELSAMSTHGLIVIRPVASVAVRFFKKRYENKYGFPYVDN